MESWMFSAITISASLCVSAGAFSFTIRNLRERLQCAEKKLEMQQDALTTAKTSLHYIEDSIKMINRKLDRLLDRQIDELRKES